MDAFAIEMEPKQNALWLRFSGRVSPDAMAAKRAEAEACVTRMKFGFTVVADLTELEEMELDCVPHVTHMMDVLLAAKVGEVIRIIPDANKDIGFTLLSLTHYRGRVPIRTIASRAELSSLLRSPAS